MVDLSALTPVPALAAGLGVNPTAGTAAAMAPTVREGAAFAQAIANTAPVEQTTAALPSHNPAAALNATLSHGFDAFATRVQSSRHSAGIAGPDAAVLQTSTANFKQVVGKALESMQGAYALAIETTMASRGSTETTKIFNTLLKGQ